MGGYATGSCIGIAGSGGATCIATGLAAGVSDDAGKSGA
jgi:hypothetical protein